MKREEVNDEAGDALASVDWVLPHEPLGAEVSRVLEAGYARGADVWHLARALWVQTQVGDLRFLTLDGQQGELARAVGLR